MAAGQQLAAVHDPHHDRHRRTGTIGPAEKLGPRADLCVLVGYDPNGLGYRVAELPSFNVRTALHVTFVEKFFPCVTKVTPYLGEFMTADQQRRYAGDGHDADHARQQVAAAMPK